MKRKGFTLVELMGIIILIGMIAVITLPSVKIIIDDSKQKGYERQIDFIISGAKNWGITNSDLLPDSDSILVSISTLKREGFLENERINNPINNKEINGCVLVNYNEDYNQYEYDYYDECILPDSLNSLVTTSPEVTSVPACITNGTVCASGTPVAIKVNKSDVYNFYVIADNGEDVTLIMDKNIGDTVAWYNDNDDTANNETNTLGPITSLNYLNSQTQTWVNIPAMGNYEYINNLNGVANTYGYQKLVINKGKGILTSQDGVTLTKLTGTSRARLLTSEEVDYLTAANSGTIPTYLYTNIRCTNIDGLPEGYWYLTSETYFSECAYSMQCPGGTPIIYEVYSGAANGVRPVVQLSKSSKVY